MLKIADKRKEEDGRKSIPPMEILIALKVTHMASLSKVKKGKLGSL